MPGSDERHTQTSTEDAAFIAGARRLGETLKGHPFALGFLAMTITYIALTAVIIVCGLAVVRHQRRHIMGLPAEPHL